MSAGAWDAMIRDELERGALITAVPGIPPSEPVEPPIISSQAGLAGLPRNVARR